jgi:hypothetical protein
MKKTTWIPLVSGFMTMTVLFIMGSLADIPFLLFNIGPSFIEISFLPIIFGFLAACVSEKVIHMQSIS